MFLIDFSNKIVIQDAGYFHKEVDVDFFSTEDIVHIGAVAMQQFCKSGDAYGSLNEYFFDSFSDVNFF